MPADILITANLVGKYYGSDPLFSDISLQIFDNEKTGLIGPNGIGKSTFLRILAGVESTDAGDLSQSKGKRILYLPQEDEMDPEKTIGEILFGAVPQGLEAWEVDKRRQEILGLIEVDREDQKVATLSGGWRKRIAIGRALFQKPDLLLLDEPTNHLDLEGILWLETLLKEAPFAFVLVSHDRYFLENTTRRIVEIDRRYPDGHFKAEGAYSAFIEKREKFLQEQANLESVLSNKVRREIEWLRQGPKARTSKARYRIDQAHQLQEDLADVKDRNAQNRRVEIDFDATYRKTKILLEATSLEKSLGGNPLFTRLNLRLTPGSGLGIMGRNGTGKSTLIRVLDGRLPPDAGNIRTPEGIRIVTLNQNRELPDQHRSLRETLSPEGDSVIYRGKPVHVTAWAKRFLFRPEQLGMPVAGLSGGEKARVLIAELVRRPADILLLDEPTNDLDIPTLEVLEESLEAFPGALVLITHDRFLMERLCDRLLVLDGKGGVETFADYDQWLNSRQDREPAKAHPKISAAPAPTPPPGKLAREKRKDLSRIERKIEKMETQADDLEKQLHDPEIMSDAEKLARIYSDHEEAKKQIDALYSQWEKLDAEIGN